MSLLRRDEICVFLSPETVRLIRRSGYWRPAILDTVIIPCIGNTDAAWSSPISILDMIIQKEPWNNGNVTVILSNHFVRYLVIPWNELLLKKDEQHVYINHLFNETYGDSTANYELRCSPEKTEKPRIASAVDNSLIQRIKEIFSSSPGLKLKSLKPHLMNSYNLNYHQLRNQDGWFVTLEPGRICVAGRGLDQWQCVRSMRIGTDWLNDLNDIFIREQLGEYADIIPDRAYLWAPEQHRCPPHLDNGWPVVQLMPKPVAGLSPVTDTSYFMMARD